MSAQSIGIIQHKAREDHEGHSRRYSSGLLNEIRNKSPRRSSRSFANFVLNPRIAASNVVQEDRDVIIRAAVRITVHFIQRLAEADQDRIIDQRCGHSAFHASILAGTSAGCIGLGAAALTNAPCRNSSACTSATGTARGATLRATDTPAAAPAAWPVSQHCGISRMNEWLAASQDTWRPATSSPSTVRGTRQPYGTDIGAIFGDSEGDTPISSG